MKKKNNFSFVSKNKKFSYLLYCLIFLVVLFPYYIYIYQNSSDQTAFNFFFSYAVNNEVNFNKTLWKTKTNHDGKKLSINGPTVAGYGNKIYSMLSALTIAMITDSEFISLWPNIGEFIEEPFPNSFIAAKTIDIKKLEKTNSIYKPATKNAWHIKKDMAKIVNTTIPNNYSVYYYASIPAFFFELCTNKVYYKKLLTKNLTSSKTIEEAEKGK
jgi:hypothetical protein